MYLDANETAFFLRSLEHVKSKTYDVKRKALKAYELIPVDMTAHPGADTITYRQFDSIGIAKFVGDYANDFPRVDTIGVEVTKKIKSVGDSFGYNVKEIRRAQLAKTDLNTLRAKAARHAAESLINNTSLTGSTAYGFNGLFNYPGINEYTVPAGASTTKTFATKTPDEIVKDFAGMVSAVRTITNAVEEVDTFVLPVAQYTDIETRRMTDGNSKTVLTYLLENLKSVKTITWANELDGIGAGGTDRIFAYTKSPDHLVMDIPLPFEMFAAQQKGLEYVVPCHAEYAGVTFFYPLSAVFGDGI